MEEIKKVNWKPEDNNYLNKVLDKINIILAFSLILAPIITSLFCLFGFKMDFLNVQLMIYFIYIICK